MPLTVMKELINAGFKHGESNDPKEGSANKEISDSLRNFRGSRHRLKKTVVYNGQTAEKGGSNVGGGKDSRSPSLEDLVAHCTKSKRALIYTGGI